QAFFVVVGARNVLTVPVAALQPLPGAAPVSVPLAEGGAAGGAGGAASPPSLDAAQIASRFGASAADAGASQAAAGGDGESSSTAEIARRFGPAALGATDQQAVQPPSPAFSPTHQVRVMRADGTIEERPVEIG